MSIRSIIEINHDYLHRLADEPEHLQKLLESLKFGDRESLEAGDIPGIKFIGERHHSESRIFTVE